MSPAELPAALDSTLMVPRSGLQHAAITSYGYKLQCLRMQVRRIALERDKAKLDLEKAETCCLQLGRELEEQYVALKHTQSKLKDVQAEIEAKELLLQQAVNHQVKLEADRRFLQGKEARLQGRLNHERKESTQLQNRVTEMAQKLAASEKLVLELQKELIHVVKDRVAFLSLLWLYRNVSGTRQKIDPFLGNFGWARRGPSAQTSRIGMSALQRLSWSTSGSARESRCCGNRMECCGGSWKGCVSGYRRAGLREGCQQEGSSLPVCRSPSPLVPASVCTEMTLSMQQLQEQLWDLKVQLETKTNYYEEEIELMRRNFEKERKISEESFKAVMHKMEDQKRELEERVAKGELCRLLEENSLMKNQLQRLQQELRLAKEKGNGHNETHVNNLGRQKVEELAEIAELTASSEKSEGEEVSDLNVKMCQLGHELGEHKASQRPKVEAEWPQGAEAAVRLEHHQQHAACWMEMKLLQQQLKTLQEKLLEAKASLSLAQTCHAQQLQQAKAQMNNMVPKKQLEQLQNSLREERCKAQQLQENLHQQAEQTCRQLVRTQEEHERLLQAAVEQAEGLEHHLRSAEAVLAERAAQLKDTQAQLSRNKLLIKVLREENRGFAMALQAAELKQKSTEERNQLLEEQASALKQLIGKITPASLSG